MINEDVIELPSNMLLEQLKVRVKEWLRGSVGNKYSFHLLNEYHVRLSRFARYIPGISFLLLFGLEK